MLGPIRTPVRHIAQIDTPIFGWEINMTHFSPAGFERLMGSHHLLCDIMKYRRTKSKSASCEACSTDEYEKKKNFRHQLEEFRQTQPVSMLVYPHTNINCSDGDMSQNLCK